MILSETIIFKEEINASRNLITKIYSFKNPSTPQQETKATNASLSWSRVLEPPNLKAVPQLCEQSINRHCPVKRRESRPCLARHL